MDLVLDASVTLAWCFADEATAETQKLLDAFDTCKAYVPSIWALEIGNVLLGAQRAKRITYAEITQFLSLLSNLDIQIDENTAVKAFHETLSFAYSEGLTTYDAAYLELAMRKGLPLATKDKKLNKIAKQLGVKILLEKL